MLSPDKIGNYLIFIHFISKLEKAISSSSFIPVTRRLMLFSSDITSRFSRLSACLRRERKSRSSLITS